MKTIISTLALIVICAVVFGILNFSKFKRLYRVITLFDKRNIVHNFRNLDKYFPVTRIQPAQNPQPLPVRDTFIELPSTFTFKGEIVDVKEFLEENQLEGLMIVHNNEIVYEEYRKGLKPSDTHIAWSVSKSWVSAMLGIAWDRGLFKLEESITKYLPQFVGTGYENVPIKDVLQMSSGVRFDEDYGKFNSDINRFGRVFALGSSFEDFAKTLKNKHKPGTFNHYVSIDTQVLGMLIEKITGQKLTDFLQKELWEPLGCEYGAEWVKDNTGMVMALGGLNMTLRDFSKLGQLYLNKGKVKGKQLISEKWISMSTTPSDPHLMPGARENASHEQGYGFQWWIPKNHDGSDFFAYGIYDQYIYISPRKNIVITTLSANYHYKKRVLRKQVKQIVLSRTIADMF